MYQNFKFHLRNQKLQPTSNPTPQKLIPEQLEPLTTPPKTLLLPKGDGVELGVIYNYINNSHHRIEGIWNLRGDRSWVYNGFHRDDSAFLLLALVVFLS